MIIVDLAEFRARHGKPVKDGRHLYYPDGAQEWQDSFGVRLEEPPAGHAEQAAAVRRYHLAALKRAHHEYGQCRYAVLLGRGTYRWDCDAYGPPPADGRAALDRLEAEVREHERAIARLDARLDVLLGRAAPAAPAAAYHAPSAATSSSATVSSATVSSDSADQAASAAPPARRVSEHQAEFARAMARVAPGRLYPHG